MSATRVPVRERMRVLRDLARAAMAFEGLPHDPASVTDRCVRMLEGARAEAGVDAFLHAHHVRILTGLQREEEGPAWVH